MPQAVCMFVKCCPYKISKFCIVPGKRPWVLAAKMPKFEDGQLHRESVLNGSTIPVQGPTLDAKLAAMGQN